MRPIQALKNQLNDPYGIWEAERREKELEKPGAMLFNRVKRKQKVQLKDSTGFEDLQAQFDSADNRGQTVRKQVLDYNGLGPGRIIIKSKTNTPAGIFFYPDDPTFDKKAVESVKGWGRFFTAPSEFVPLLSPFIARTAPHRTVIHRGNKQLDLGGQRGGHTFRQRRELNKSKKLFLNDLELQRFENAINITPTFTPPPKVSGFNPKGLIQEQMFKLTKEQQVKFVSNMWRYDTSPTTTTSKIGNLKNALVNQKESDIASRMVTGKTKDHKLMRERVSADNPTALAYRELITKYDNLKANIGDATLDTVISQSEFEADVKQLIELKSKDGLDLPNKTQFSKELGNFAIDGKLQYWGSKGVFKPVSTSGQERVGDQAQMPATVEFDPLRPKWGPFVNSLRHKTALKLGLKKPEKDHLMRLKNQEAILSKTLNAEGEFVRRPAAFMDQLAGILHRRGHHLGDQNLNWLMMSEEAHRTGKYSRHVVSQGMTDLELPKTLAEAQQQQLILNDGRTIIADHKDGKYYLDDVQIKPKEIKEKGNYYFAGKEYEKGQRQGLSLTTRKVLAKIDNPEDLADAYELFATDAGAHEIMSGIQTAASFIYDNDAELDALSRQIRNENIPNMIKFLEFTLKNVPQYKNDPVYTKLLNRFTDKLKQNMAEYGEALQQDDTRPSVFQESERRI